MEHFGYNEITREMIEGCLDDELDLQYDAWETGNVHLYASSSKIIKNLFPSSYYEFFIDYCDRNKIKIETSETGIKYFEPKED